MEDRGLIPRRPPEMLEADLAPLALELAAWGVADPARLQWLDLPPDGAFSQARELLSGLGALDETGTITAHGRRVVELPAHPRIAHMMLQATTLGLLPLACDIAALVDERDVLRRDSDAGDADVRFRLDALRTLRKRGRLPASIDAAALARVRERADEWRRRVRLAREAAAVESNDAGLLLAFAWPDRVGRARGARGRFVLRNGRGVSVPASHALAGSTFIVAAMVGGRGADATVYLGAPLDEADLERSFADQIETTTVVEWDASRRAVRTERRTILGAIILRRTSATGVDPEPIRLALLEGIRSEGIAALPWSDEARQLRLRIAFLRSTDDAWPDVSDAALLERLDEWLGPWLGGLSSFDQIRQTDLHRVLMAWLEPARRAHIETLAPTHIEVPSGSRHAIDYGDPGTPVLAVRLQELFGMIETPRLAGVPLTIHLLSPAMRPVQVTRDLGSFWRTGYFEVRKDLRGRYPKHYWPEDPLTATATRRTRPRS